MLLANYVVLIPLTAVPTLRRPVLHCLLHTLRLTSAAAAAAAAAALWVLPLLLMLLAATNVVVSAAPSLSVGPKAGSLVPIPRLSFFSTSASALHLTSSFLSILPASCSLTPSLS
ncbi:hypothetical protein Pmani_018183 [Petrolisthes manimaculis]|uniref:Uncharacterized protein n=1 Tax=Petrolisthes manimaculis TaxID=1843537 RepID=A0AAE1U8L7_9EUCA|nr:hypothetical protein Pmani_018183 [Petrolisthes manimaculis]